MANKSVPMRMCVSCREMKPKSELIRIVKTTDDNIELDLTGKKAGRGAYICNDVECFSKLAKNKGLERAFKMKVSDEILANLEEQVKKGCE